MALLFAFLALASTLPAQAPYRYMNEWYRFNQNYIKIRLWQDGPYRVYLSDLVTAGVPNLGTLQPDNLQLIYRGSEQSLRVVKTPSGDLDYFEFEGKRNDGGIDSLMYRSPYPPFEFDPEQQPNRFSSFFTDTTAYFLTWDSTGTRRRQVSTTSTNFGAYTSEGTYRYRILEEYKGSYHEGGGGRADPNHILNSDYITGEGFSSNTFDPASTPDYVAKLVTVKGFVPGGAPTKLNARIFHVTSSDQHILDISLNGTTVHRDTSVGLLIGTRQVTTGLNLTAQTAVRFRAFGAGSRPDKQRVAWFTLEYNRNFDLEGDNRTIVRDYQQTDTTYLRFINADITSEAWLWDPYTNQHIQAHVSGDTLRFLVPGHSQPRELYVYTDKAILSPLIAPKTSLANISDPNAGAEFIIITDPRFANSATHYATYRDTNTVNRLSAKVVFVEEIIDEFGYGSMTPMAIKHFVKYALDNWSTKPKFVLLWGKGRPNPRIENAFNYVPSFGQPANDYEYVSNFQRDSVDLVPVIPIGRLCLYEDQQGMDYLAKVMAYERQEYEGWMKTAVFLGGGKTSSEQAAIKDALLNRFRPPLISAPVGGEVNWFQNEHNAITTNSETASHNLIDQGVGIIQFFGHSSTNIFDVDILEANRYDNWGKYPLMVAFGCYGGDFIQREQSFGERFVLEAGRGSIGYLANTTEGFLGQLRDYGLALHTQLSTGQVGVPLGRAIAETIRMYAQMGFSTTNILTANHCKQMNLQGDPSVVIHLPTKPDLALEESKIWFNPENLNAEEDSFQVWIAIRNHGSYFSDSVVLRIQQRLPSGATVDHRDTLVAPMLLEDTISVRLPNVAGRAMAGINRFTVHIDALDSLDEYKEPNNIVDKTVIVQGSTPAIIHPYPFAIVAQDTLSLVAGSYILDTRSLVRYSFEIDTVHEFNSGFKILSDPIEGNSVAGSWRIPANLQPGKVYYWRVRYTDTYPVQWATGSFKYLPGKTGWSQSRPPQFFEDPTEALTLDRISRTWAFDPITVQLHALIHSFGIQAVNGRPDYFMGSYNSSNAPPNGIVYTGINQHTLAPYWRNTNYGDWAFLAAPSPSDPNTVLDLVTAIATMPQGDYLLMATSDNARFQDWKPEYLHALEQVGVDPTTIDRLQNEERAIVFGQKGAAPGTGIVIDKPNLEISGQPPRHDLIKDISSSASWGRLYSPIIGPARSWSNAHFNWRSTEGLARDSAMLDITGIGATDAGIPLIQDLDRGTHAISSIDAAVFPRITLQADLKDEAYRTAPQVEAWEVYYEPAPDMALDPVNPLQIPDTIEEGQIVEVRIGLRNLTDTPTDSVEIAFSLQRPDRSMAQLGSTWHAPLPAKADTFVSFRFHSAGKGLTEGLASMIIDLNPNGAQPELHFFNNRFQQDIYVITDKVGPLLDVTIDGKHLMEGDIVQPDPEIVIMVNDENRYLPVSISDSTYFIWFGPERNFNFNPQLQIETDPRIEASPGRLPENKARLSFRPGRLPDGEYTLAVQSRDFKGNASGKAQYVIHFTVESEKAISEVLPYPNPFSTSTRFAYTLTGDEKPYVFELHIYTITGHLVKVIDLLELGEVYFGHNLTTFSWDGRDEFGDLLANGVYIYKTHVKFKDRYGVKQIDNGLGDYFKNGYGKLYILR